MYHVELRQFPHNLCRFNLDERELRAILVPWSREQWVELGERRWSPHQAKLTVLEGPRVPLDQLSMGRGWRAAQRESEDVTERVLAAATQARGATSEDRPPPSPPEPSLLADSLGLELLALLGEGPAPLSEAWRLAAARVPELSPAGSLALAERAVGSLLLGRLIVLLHATSHPTGGRPDAPPGGADGKPDEAQVGGAELAPVLGSLDSWAASGEPRGVRMRKV